MTQLHHIGYWVDDLDAAMERASRTLGVGPFLVHPHVAFDSFTLADGTAVTDPGYFDHSAAFTAWGPVVLELGVVHAVHPDLEAAYGIRVGEVGHVSWVVDDLEAESRRLAGLGCEPIHEAEVGGGAVHVAWHRGGPLFPHPIEVHRAGPAILGMQPRLAALAADWDGTVLARPMSAPPEETHR
jgi:catechol 2,3-dioxygenase-like lactoylglutathione lyase family enzyme